MITLKKTVVLTVILIVLQLQNVITELQQKASPSSFLWEPLLEVENEHFTKAFLPSYINFTRDIVGSKWISPSCNVRLQAALDALLLRRDWASKL